MRIIDCDARYGVDGAFPPIKPCHTAAELLFEMDNAGIESAFVFRSETETAGAVNGDALLFGDVRLNSRLHAVATILPTHTDEFPQPEALEGWLKANRIKALRLSPKTQRYELSKAAIGDTLCEAARLKVPIYVNTAFGAGFADVERLLSDFPTLRIMLIYANCWPSARLLYPMVKGHENVRIALTYMFTQDGIEDFVSRYGAGCLAYGSGFPASYMGSGILMARHARIPEAAREAILGLNTLAWMEDAP